MKHARLFATLLDTWFPPHFGNARLVAKMSFKEYRESCGNPSKSVVSFWPDDDTMFDLVKYCADARFRIANVSAPISNNVKTRHDPKSRKPCAFFMASTSLSWLHALELGTHNMTAFILYVPQDAFKGNNT
jgi:hypothetical protein